MKGQHDNTISPWLFAKRTNDEVGFGSEGRPGFLGLLQGLGSLELDEWMLRTQGLSCSIFYFFNILFLERGEGREKRREIERERNMGVGEIHRWVASCMRPTRDLDCNPGTCPDRESNEQPFDLQDDAHSTEPHQSGNLLLLRTVSHTSGDKELTTTQG